MAINIIKKEDSKIYFTLNRTDYEFNYEGLDAFIEAFYSNTEEATIECEDEFNEYKQLLQKILEECRKDDYIKAVNEAIESQKAIDELDDDDQEIVTDEN